MKYFFTLFLSLSFTFCLFAQNDLIITGVVDGPLAGGTPKAVELYVINGIADLSIYGLGAANNGGGTDGEEFTFPAQGASAGTFLYLTTDNAQFNAFFGFDADFISEGSSSAAGINGDDAIELFWNGEVVDVFGDINQDGSGTAWDYLDGWAYRVDGTGPDGFTFQIANWTFSGIDALDDETTNATAANPFPIGTYSTSGSELVNANDDNVTIETNETIDIDVIANDFIPNDLTSLAIVQNGTIGNGVIVNNQLRYIPAQDMCGMDTLKYEVCNLISCDTANVFVTINCIIDYPSFTIGEVTAEDANGVALSDELKVKLQGIAYGVNLRPAGLQFALIDDVGDGITVFSFTENFGYFVQEGDELIIQGEISQFNGLTEVIPETLELVSQGNSLVAPSSVSELNEDTESRLVRISGYTLVDPAQWTNMGDGFNFDVTDGFDTLSIRIDNNVDIFGTDVPTGLLEITGIGTQYDEESPYLEGYSLIPRYLPDINVISNVVDPGLKAILQIFPNPVIHNQLTVSLQEKVDGIILRDINGRLLNTQLDREGEIQYDFSKYPAGIYTITIQQGRRIWTEEIIKN